MEIYSTQADNFEEFAFPIHGTNMFLNVSYQSTMANQFIQLFEHLEYLIEYFGGEIMATTEILEKGYMKAIQGNGGVYYHFVPKKPNQIEVYHHDNLVMILNIEVDSTDNFELHVVPEDLEILKKYVEAVSAFTN